MPDYLLFEKKNPREKVTRLFGEQSLRAVIYASQILAQLSSRKTLRRVSKLPACALRGKSGRARGALLAEGARALAHAPVTWGDNFYALNSFFFFAKQNKTETQEIETRERIFLLLENLNRKNNCKFLNEPEMTQKCCVCANPFLRKRFCEETVWK